MANCPKCQTDLGEQDFGLIECPGCGASLMIDLDGSVETHSGDPSELLQQDEAEGEDNKVEEYVAESTAAIDEKASFGDFETALVEAGPSATTTTASSLSEQLLDDLGDMTQASVPTGEADRMLQDPENWSTEGISEEPETPEGLDASEFTGSYQTSDIPSIGHVTTDIPKLSEVEPDNRAETDTKADTGTETFEDDLVESESPDLSSEGSEYEEEVFEEAAVQGDEEHYDGNYEQGEELATSGEPASVDEIAEYGNSDVSQKGAIRYDLSIGHIDSQEIRDEVYNVLADKRLMFNVDELFSGIENGVIRLSDISSVKAYVVMSSLVGTRVSLDWKQRVETNV